MADVAVVDASAVIDAATTGARFDSFTPLVGEYGGRVV